MGAPQLVRMHERQLAEIDSWIAGQTEKLSRPKAIRRLVDIGLRATAMQAAVDLAEAETHAAQAKKLAKELGLRAKKRV